MSSDGTSGEAGGGGGGGGLLAVPTSPGEIGAIVVLVVGLIIVAVLVIVLIIEYASNNNSLATAQQNLTNAINLTVATFQSIGVRLYSTLTRVATVLRDQFESFITNITNFLAQSITYFTNTITRIYRQLEQITIKLSRLYVEIYYKLNDGLAQLAGQISAKLTTLPTTIGSKVVVYFTTLLSDAIRFLLCGTVKLSNDVAKVSDTVFNDIKSYLDNTYFVTNIVDPIENYLGNKIDDIVSDIGSGASSFFSSI